MWEGLGREEGDLLDRLGWKIGDLRVGIAGLVVALVRHELVVGAVL